MKIYSPAIISAKEKVVVGHGSNLVWCDILGRRYRQKGQKVEYFFPSLNNHGKRFDGVDRQHLDESLKEIRICLERKLGLFGIDSYQTYEDSNPDSERNTQKYFRILQNRTFIKQVGEQYFLDISRIIQGTDFIENLKKINFAPSGEVRKRLFDLTKTLSGLYPISKPRDFATEIPSFTNKHEKINPIFDLAVSPALFSEGSIDYAVDGSRTLLPGLFIPLAVWSGLFNRVFSKNICVHGYATNEGSRDVEEFYKQIRTKLIQSDILRYCALQCTDSFEDTGLNQDRILGAEKLLYRVLNLSKHILKHLGPQKREDNENEGLGEMIDKMNHIKALYSFESEMFAISGRTHHAGQIDKSDAREFLRSLNTMEPFFPITIKRTKEIVYGGRV